MNISNTIPEYFAGKNILITGGTGFIGKVLIEHFLTTCPDIGNIYLLIRPKRNVSVSERWELLKKNVLYDDVRRHNPKSFNKIRLIKGDTAELKLGINEEDRKEIIENVSIIYHIAATINFHAPFNKSILINVRGTREICDLMLKLKTPEVLCHVSTTYCHVKEKILEEKIYSGFKDWKELIEIAENMDGNILNITTKKIQEGYPNTYSYSKALAESVLRDMCSGKVPTVIIRPAIVAPTVQYPRMGWTDNIKTVTGFWVGAVIGVQRIVPFGIDIKLDLISVDIVAENMITTVWYQQFSTKTNPISVYNSVSDEVKPSFGEIKEKLSIIVKHSPISIWYPVLTMTKSMIWYRISVILFQFLPCLLLDFIATIIKKKPIAANLQRKMFREYMTQRYFMNRNWEFSTGKIKEIEKKLNESDRKLFTYNPDNYDLCEHVLIFLDVVRKEFLPQIKKSKRRLQW